MDNNYELLSYNIKKTRVIKINNIINRISAVLNYTVFLLLFSSLSLNVFKEGNKTHCGTQSPWYTMWQFWCTVWQFIPWYLNVPNLIGYTCLLLLKYWRHFTRSRENWNTLQRKTSRMAQDLSQQGAKKVRFTACPLDKLQLHVAFTSPRVIIV